MGWSWWWRYGPLTLINDGASAALAAALCGFLLLLALGVAHGFGAMSGHDAVSAFIAAFLLPLDLCVYCAYSSERKYFTPFDEMKVGWVPSVVAIAMVALVIPGVCTLMGLQ